MPSRMMIWSSVSSGGAAPSARQPIDLDELLRLQRIVIGDAWLVCLGLHSEGGFVGERDRESGMPISHHFNARLEHLTRLVKGMLTFEQQAAQQIDPVVAASILAFALSISPFRGRKRPATPLSGPHVLARWGFNPPGVVFPVSPAILERIDDYHLILENYSRRLLRVVDWEPVDSGNVGVLNDTDEFYRFFDAKPHTEFLYRYVQQTIEHDLPGEAAFLKRPDEFRRELNLMLDMPERLYDLLFQFLHRNAGTLSHRGQEKEFAALTDDEVARIETIHRKVFVDVSA